MSKIYTEKKECENCHKTKMISTCNDICSTCRMESHDAIDYALQNLCLGRPYNYQQPGV